MNRTHVRIVAIAAFLAALSACNTAPKPTVEEPTTIPVTRIDADKPIAPKVEVPVAQLPTLRIKAGLDEPLTDKKGNVWAAESGFEGGQSVNRDDLEVKNTDSPEIYQSEHYGMTSFSTKLPNGSYTLKLHFSEDYDGLTSENDRIFTYAVKDGAPDTGTTLKEVKDFSPWKAAKAQFTAYVDTIPVTITSGQLSIKFTAQVENPQINAIEITPK